MSFESLQLIEPLLRAVARQGYTDPTPIQTAAIPVVMTGRDLLACAQTGTGKTAAFALPILQRLASRPVVSAPGRFRRAIRVVVLAPTRELAAQIGESFAAYGDGLGLRGTTIFGGVSQRRQELALSAGVDILVATPGRLLDLMGQGIVRLDAVEVLVLDEADRMLDLGFIHPIRKIAQAVPRTRQTLLFSATLSPEIRELAGGIMRDPASVSVAPPATTAERIDQTVFLVEKPDKMDLLLHVLDRHDVTRALVFTRTKHGADKVVRHLTKSDVSAGAIHGNKSQNHRERVLRDFKTGASRVLVATDIAARGLDIDDVSHVVNFDLPVDAESYVHRIGRTARAGASGTAMSFCGSDERAALRSIEKLIRLNIPQSPLPGFERAPRLEGPPPWERKTQTHRDSSGHDRPSASAASAERARESSAAHSTRPDGPTARPLVSNRREADVTNKTHRSAAPARRHYFDSQRPDSQRPDSRRPDAQRFDSRRPDARRPDARRPDAQRFDSRRPGGRRASAPSAHKD